MEMAADGRISDGKTLVTLLRWELLHPQNLALAAVLSTSTLLLKRIFFDRRLAAKQATSAN